MKSLIRGAIRLYWRFWPERWRRSCLFRESCSRHVYRMTTESGTIAGLAALRKRLRQCRPGFVASLDSGGLTLILANGDRISGHQISEEISGRRE